MEDARRRLSEELTALDATVLSITESTTDLPRTLHTIVELAISLLRVDAGGLYLCDPERQEVRRVVSYKMPAEAPSIVLKYGEGAAGTVAKTHQPLIIDDYRTWPGRAAAYDYVKGFRAFLSVPLIWQGEVTGVINVVSYKEARRFNQDDLNLLTRFATHAAIVVERKKLEDRLRESEMKFRRIAEGSFDPLVTMDLQGHLTYASPALFLMTGYTADQVIGQHFTVFLPDDERAKRIQAFNSVLGGAVVRGQETKLLCADGSLVHVEITTSPITESGAAVTGVEAVLRDVTDRRMLAELKDRFMASATHELRTPLVSMLGYLDLTLSEPNKLTKEVESHLQVVKRNTDRLLSLTNDLLDVQRMQAGRLQLNMQPINLHEVITEIINEIRPLIDEKKQNLNLKLPTGPLPVHADPIRLSQVFVNLLSNASKFAPESGEITLSVEETEDTIQVQVSDKGIGIKPEDLKRIFEPFAEIEKPDYFKGTGLGLSITKGLVEAHGGKISAESAGEGKGATLTFTIPKRRT
jgi:PAS domain S-box-containing protein